MAPELPPGPFLRRIGHRFEQDLGLTLGFATPLKNANPHFTGTGGTALRVTAFVRPRTGIRVARRAQSPESP